MPHFQTTRRVAHKPEQMFALVADVERYPEFVPMCKGLRILKREQADDGLDIIVARMTVAYKLFQESFTTRVRLDRERLEILVQYLDGPFRRLENKWVFAPAGEHACSVEFDLDYEFRSLILQSLMGSVFDRAFRKFSSAFEARANAIYGGGSYAGEAATAPLA